MGAPVIRNNVAIGMLSRIVSEEFLAVNDLYYSVKEIKILCDTRQKIPTKKIPRRRARIDQCMGPHQESVANFLQLKKRKRKSSTEVVTVHEIHE